MKYIERNRLRGFGQPVIVGRRLTVFSVISYVSDPEIRINDFLRDFDMTSEELHAAVLYCKNRECRHMSNPSDQYCDGCILRSMGAGWKSLKDDYDEVDGISYSKDSKSMFLGTLDELEESEIGVIGWLLAENAEERLTNNG
ncbi:DUF433 domain-containing protein [Chitinophaga sp. CF418]|uniref:DUF433 domain-containing protein n=1 Tax=Chitinophaga sp. CF418 TaxID=1855287 RepID=UPI00091EAB2D|nr:DUF433 domain-containing protein [Chitinophaga sp. CF418]SHN07907.1 Uncharacterized conserved protein, DUF433 family [Chitinophaga sp. CF418]